MFSIYLYFTALTVVTVLGGIVTAYNINSFFKEYFKTNHSDLLDD